MEKLLKQIIELIEKERPKYQIVIIETSCSLYEVDVANILNQNTEKLDISIWKSNEYGGAKHQILGNATTITSEDELIDKIKAATLVLIPCLSRDLLVKGALCISDSSSSYALQIALMKGKTIIAMDSGTNLKSEYSRLQGFNTNYNYYQTLKVYHDKLVGLGVKIVSIFDFSNTFNYCLENARPSVENKIDNPSILTRRDVVGKKTITLNHNTKLTELAKDYIMDNDIVLNQH